MNQEEKYKEILKLIAEYNQAAIEENSNARLGLAASHAYGKRKNFEEWIKENCNYEYTNVSIETVGTDDGWFPSSICN